MTNFVKLHEEGKDIWVNMDMVAHVDDFKGMARLTFADDSQLDVDETVTTVMELTGSLWPDAEQIAQEAKTMLEKFGITLDDPLEETCACGKNTKCACDY